MIFTTRQFNCNGQDIHCKVAGPTDGPVILFLHGFPEYWAAWAEVASHLATTHRVFLPDQRGFNMSSKPVGVDAYDTKHLVADMADLISQISPGRPIVLCGHDWGASVAYALAMRHGDLVSHLIIANGVHPICFQKALFAGGTQTDASQYINILREKNSEERLSRDGFTPLLGMLEKFSSAGWLDDSQRSNYREAWSKPGAITAMLHWYRASKMQVPKTGAAPQELEITDEMRAKYSITMPHLLLWGEQDTALRPETHADLGTFCADLTVISADDASHWVLHEKPAWVAQHIQAFL